MIAKFMSLSNWLAPLSRRQVMVSLERPSLTHLAHSTCPLPWFVAESALACHYLTLLGSLDWDQFPERDPARPWWPLT